MNIHHCIPYEPVPPLANGALVDFITEETVVSGILDTNVPVLPLPANRDPNQLDDTGAVAC
jgi:hypothetical protein